MGIKFFGQFLIELGVVDAAGLHAALELMEQENLTVGDLAVRAGFATEAECLRVNTEQRRLDRRFGELAQEMGILNAVEVEEILLNQLETRINVGDALIRLGQITREQLSEYEELFKRDQADVGRGNAILPKALANIRVAKTLVDLLPRLCMRTARLAVRIADGQIFVAPDPETNLVASVMMTGNPGVEVLMLAEIAFARKLSSGIAGLPEDSLNAELCLDGLGEFLNVLAGNAMSDLETKGVEYRLEAPRYGHFPQDGWHFRIASDWGKASLVLLES